MKKICFFLLFLSSAAFGQQQVWKAMRTSQNGFTYSRDGQEAACLSNGTVIAAGGWHTIDDQEEVSNEVYASADRGQTWTRLADAPWPASHDFLFSSSVTGDTLVKWGGDGANEQSGHARRIDIYTPAGGWQNLASDYGDAANSGLQLTGCRHKQWYYMLGSNGKLTRFTLDNPEPEFVSELTGDLNVISGFLLSLPNGRMILGGGLCVAYTEPVFTGKCFYSDDDGLTWTEFYQDDLFKNYWCKATVTKTGVVFWRGRDDSPASGLKGVYTTPVNNLMYRVNVAAWTPLDYSPEPRHAEGLCTLIDASGKPTDDAVGVCGNLFNDSWLYRRMDNEEEEIPMNGCTFTVPNLIDSAYASLGAVQWPAAGTQVPAADSQLHAVVIMANYNGQPAVADTFYFRSRDRVPPTISGPADTTVYMGANCIYTVPDLRNAVHATDGCGLVTVTQDPAPGPMDRSVNASPFITLTASDAAGNKSSWRTQLVIRDTIAPRLALPAAISVANDAGNCGALVPVEPLAFSDNCTGAVTLTVRRSDSLTIGAAYPVGTTTLTWRAADSSGNYSEAVQTVTVTDTSAPRLQGPPSLVFCAGDSRYTLPPLRYTDNCGIASVLYTVSGATARSGNGADASGELLPGLSRIAWTVTDIHGNHSTWQTDVRIGLPVTVEIPAVYAVPKGAAPNTLYIGYGPATLTLQAQVAGGFAPYTFNWTSGAHGPVLPVQRPAGIYTYGVNVTDSIGCTASATADVVVADIQCGLNRKNVSVCLPAGSGVSTVCADSATVAALLVQGASLGACIESAASGTAGQLLASIDPNPTPGDFQLSIRSRSDEAVTVRVFSAAGVLVGQYGHVSPNGILSLGDRYARGLYLVEVLQGRERSVIKAVKL